MPDDIFDSDDRYVFVPELDGYILKATKRYFSSKDELDAYLESNAEQLELDAFAAHLREMAYAKLHKPAIEAGVIERGPKAGQPRKARPEKVPTQKAIDVFVTRNVNAAKLYRAWKAAA